MAEIKEQKTCAICLLDNSELNNEEIKQVDNEIIHPCPCRWVHRNCLNNWRNSHRNDAYYRCEVCHYEYRLSRVWWGNILKSKWTTVTVSLVSLGLGVGVSGYISAHGLNMVRKWFLMTYFSPVPPLQMLYHGCFWIGVPGLVLGLYDLITSGLLQVDPVQQNQNTVLSSGLDCLSSLLRIQANSSSNRSTVEVHNHHYDSNYEDKENVRERKDSKKSEKEKLKEEAKRKPHTYEGPSYAVWGTLIVGCGTVLYKTWTRIDGYARRLCANAREYVENV